jgi:hypothetical protein
LIHWFVDSFVHGFIVFLIHRFIDSLIPGITDSLLHSVSCPWVLSCLRQLIVSASQKKTYNHVIFIIISYCRSFRPARAGHYLVYAYIYTYIILHKHMEICNHSTILGWANIRVAANMFQDPEKINSTIPPWNSTIDGQWLRPWYALASCVSPRGPWHPCEGLPKPPKSRWLGGCAYFARTETETSRSDENASKSLGLGDLIGWSLDGPKIWTKHPQLSLAWHPVKPVDAASHKSSFDGFKENLNRTVSQALPNFQTISKPVHLCTSSTQWTVHFTRLRRVSVLPSTQMLRTDWVRAWWWL